MSTTQIQKVKLEQIAPKWAEMIRTNTRLDGFSLGSFEKCVVGEAYGFNDAYRTACGECWLIGMRFRFADPVSVIDKNGKILVRPFREFPKMWAYGYKGESIEEIARQFEDHWNECHLKEQL